MSELKTIALELLEKYRSAEDMCIGETSINLKADDAELDAEVAAFKARIEACEPELERPVTTPWPIHLPETSK